jgi:peptidoglycan DL-endopeptidase CwlO
MKKAVMIGVALACFLAGPTVYAAEAAGGAQGAAMKQEQKPMAHKAVKKMSRHRMSMADVKAIQEALNSHGAKLTVDGKWGKETREAIKSYQKDNGLKATGYANKKTREKLGLKF